MNCWYTSMGTPVSYTYLYLRGRGIDQEILDYCVQTGRIYESRNKGHGNVVFVGFDQTGKARFGCLRGIGEARFHGDLSGSDKHYSFSLPACVENPAVHLCECAIDVMSYATLCKLDGIDWRRHNLLSLAGAVSYTHLDVYKRQQLIPAHRELPLSTDGGFSFSAGVQKVGVQKVIKSAV